MNDMLSAYYRGDTAALERIEADDYVVIFNEIGTIEGRYERIDSKVRQNDWLQQPVSYSIEGMKIRSYSGGDVAITNGPAQVSIPGQDTVELLVSSVWVKHNGTWEIVQLHFNAIQTPQPNSNSEQMD